MTHSCASTHSIYYDIRAGYDYPQCERDWIAFQHFITHVVVTEDGTSDASDPCRELGPSTLKHCQCASCCEHFGERYLYWWQSGEFYPDKEDSVPRTEAPPRCEYADQPWETRYGQLPVRSVRDGAPLLSDVFSADKLTELMAPHTHQYGCILCRMQQRHEPKCQKCWERPGNAV